MIQAQGVVSDGRGQCRVEPLVVGDPTAGEVRVAIKASGVCHTDWDCMKLGRLLVLGHEGAGVVEAVGDGVTHVAVGDRVLLNWAIPCGHCFQCDRGNQSICEHAHRAHPDTGSKAHPQATLLGDQPIERAFSLGTMSTHTVVREEAVVRIDVDIPFASACIVGCGVMTGYGSVINAAKVVPGTSVVVLGTGGVGLNAIQGAKLAGAAKVIAVDVNPTRLEMARTFGATDTVLADRDDKGLLKAAEQVKAMTGGRGADYAIESTAVPELAAAPLAMVRDAGVAVQASGVEQDVTIDMNLFEWDKTYINPLYGKCRPQVDLPRILELYAQGRFQLDELVTRTYRLDQIDQAFEDMLAGRNAKGVLLIGDGDAAG